MNAKLELLNRYLASREHRLAAGEVLTVQLEDGMLTTYKEFDAKTGEQKNITLVEEFDAQLNIRIDELLLK